MHVVLFEDHHVEDLYPVSLSRPAWAVTCGVRNLRDTVTACGCTVTTIVRPHLARIVASGGAPVPPPDGPALFLNASLVPDVRLVRRLLDLAGKGDPFMVTCGDRVAAALLREGASLAESARPDDIAERLLLQKLPLCETAAAFLCYPFDIVRHHMDIFGANLEHLIGLRPFREIAKGVFAGENVKVPATAQLHAEAGPIVLDEGVVILDFALLVGPVYVGRHSRIIERATVKEMTCIGPTCKIGGEIEASVIEGYSNKQHHGFLGHSHVGSWVNMGAGTSNSDLKNTYGSIRVQIGEKRIDSGMQFFGCVIGDHSKTAINTSIFTGKIVGVASMLYGFVTTNVPSFCNYARSFGEITGIDVETAVETQRRMFKRRKVEQTELDIALMRDLHRLTERDRGLAAEPISL